MREVQGVQKSTFSPWSVRKEVERAAASMENGRVLCPTGSLSSALPPTLPTLPPFLLVLPSAGFSLVDGSSGLIFTAERVAPAKLQAGFLLGHLWPASRGMEASVNWPMVEEITGLYKKKKQKQCSPLTLSLSCHFLYMFPVNLSAPCYVIYRQSSRVWDPLYFQTW